MRKLTTTTRLTFTILLRSVGGSWSADLQKGLTVYQRGDYATVLREWTPFVEQRVLASSALQVLCTATDKVFRRTIRLR